MDERLVIDSIAAEYRRYRGLAEAAAGQLSWEQVRTPLDAETNSIAVIMKHVGGNLRSRWTDPFTTDGEKPWRNRDTEFVDDFADRAAMEAAWRTGWDIVERVLATVSDADLPRTLTIRGEPHTLALALARSLSHTSYHCGQIVLISRVLASRAGVAWATLTVPRGGSREFNEGMGYNAGA
jgi:uncharacterized damage-inducible protein DinB